MASRLPRSEPAPCTRRGLISALGAGWACFALASVAGVAAAGRMFWPTGRFEPGTLLRVGYPNEYDLGLSARWLHCCVLLGRTGEGFYALSSCCPWDSG